ncbi:MAG: NAD(+) synthase [Candidatus Zixiibacteriota bacterium]|nr:MAG: NAD(+) synthase [candidate division Zixibacteria bacterium]
MALKFSKDLIKLDCPRVVDDLVEKLNQNVYTNFRRQGAVVGTSGGVDSSVVAALCVKAFGPDKVLGAILPDQDNSPESTEFAVRLAKKLGYEYVIDDVTAPLEAAGCYKNRDDGFRMVFPEWREGWKAKIVLPSNLLESGRMNVFRLAVESPDGEKMEKRLPLKAYLNIVAASNMKQRIRMLTLYYEAEKRNYAVIGTANKNEYEQGFFVKYGDGGVDIKPIVGFYKTQIFQLAEYLDIPKEIRSRTPSAETYPSDVSQEEFFFGLDFKIMDQLWFAKEGGFAIDDVAEVTGLTVEQVERVWHDLDQKKRTTEYLRHPPILFK